MIQINGETGGGQILRTALSLSMITKKPFKMINIRSKRPNPGLRPQHLNAIKAMTLISNAKTNGAKLNSKTIEFSPGRINKKYLTLDIKTAGSTTLLLQTILPVIVHEDKHFKIWLKGGTDTKMCPPSHFFKDVFLHNLQKLGIKTKFEIEQYGFFPKGNGKVSLEVLKSQPTKLSFNKRDQLKYGRVTAVASHKLRKPKVADRLVNSFRSNFSVEMDLATDIKYPNTLSTGAVINSFLELKNYRIGSSVVGKRGVRAEQIGQECASKLLNSYESQGLDKYCADQLMIYLSLFRGKLKTQKITNHILSNKVVIEQFLDEEIKIKDNLIYS